jgi:hypothetical protein
VTGLDAPRAQMRRVQPLSPQQSTQLAAPRRSCCLTQDPVLVLRRESPPARARPPPKTRDSRATLLEARARWMGLTGLCRALVAVLVLSCATTSPCSTSSSGRSNSPSTPIWDRVVVSSSLAQRGRVKALAATHPHTRSCRYARHACTSLGHSRPARRADRRRAEQRRGATIAVELFASCCRCAPSYGLVAVGAARTVIGWLRAGEA